MRQGSLRRVLAWAGRLLAAATIVAAATGRLPHLVLTQAVVGSLLTMVAAPLILLDHSGASGRRISLPPFPAVVLMSAGIVSSQLPPAVAVIGEGGPLTVLALGTLLLMALGFWSVVMPPARLAGLMAAGYVVMGSLPISMPAMFLIMLPRDIYTVFHAAGPGPLAALDDQIFAGFVLFAFVKITLFVAFSCLFLSAFPDRVEDDGGGDGDRDRRPPPALPGWVREILRGEPTVEEPEPIARRERVESGRP